MKLLTPPLIALTGTALLGAVLAAHVLRGRFAHWSLSPVHALLGVTGLSLLLTPLTQGVPPPQVWAGFGLLCAAGGLGRWGRKHGQAKRRERDTFTQHLRLNPSFQAKPRRRPARWRDAKAQVR